MHIDRFTLPVVVHTYIVVRVLLAAQPVANSYIIIKSTTLIIKVMPTLGLSSLVLWRYQELSLASN